MGPLTSLECIKMQLQHGFEHLKQQNPFHLCVSLDYGQWLNIAFELHARDKIAGRIQETWKQWLENNIKLGIHMLENYGVLQPYWKAICYSGN